MGWALPRCRVGCSIGRAIRIEVHMQIGIGRLNAPPLDRPPFHGNLNAVRFGAKPVGDVERCEQMDRCWTCFKPDRPLFKRAEIFNGIVVGRNIERECFGQLGAIACFIGEGVLVAIRPIAEHGSKDRQTRCRRAWRLRCLIDTQ